MLKTAGLALVTAILAVLALVGTEALALTLLGVAPPGWALVDHLFVRVVLPASLVAQSVILLVGRGAFLHNRVLNVAVYLLVLNGAYVAYLVLASNPPFDIVRYLVTVTAAFCVPAAWRLRSPRAVPPAAA